MPQILIELDKEVEAEARTMFQNLSGDVSFIDAKRFDGAVVLQLLAMLNTVTIPLLAKIVIERIRANRHVVIKKKGLVIRGLSADNAVKVLSELAKND
ncbi:hypothetical protein [Chromobacterium violaceum]|uniref:hypothetical protein n=1 Tax=Chromobacterium violaceum TaxID=536 RepID=UPI0005D2E591|nr:hypothetical protein [Chromobacterium violaceum]KJH65676.1 hypothetical protein UF16_20410 [Chromobacterium violaceum]